MSSMPSGARRLNLLLLVLLFAAIAIPAQQPSKRELSPDPERLRAHVARLATDEMEGRRTGTRGAELSARYIAEQFSRYYLAPGGNFTGPLRHNRVEAKEYLQTFPYFTAVELGQNNTLALTSDPSPDEDSEQLILRIREDWMPHASSGDAKIEGLPVTFAGYGITRRGSFYDEYKLFDVAGKAAVVFAGAPDDYSSHGAFKPYTDLRLKAEAARVAGARALVIIAAKENFKEDERARFVLDDGRGDEGLPVVVISRQSAARLFDLAGTSELDELEKRWNASALSIVRDREAGARATGFKFPVPRGRLSISTHLLRRSTAAVNVVGILTGSDPKLKDEVIVVGAHYDHLGRGGMGNPNAPEDAIYSGADDNASGIAGMLELARLLSQQREQVRRTIVFIAFAGEEDGLVGSNFYVNHPVRPLRQTVAMLNMDMIGRLTDDKLSVGGVGTAVVWQTLLEEANRALDVRVVVPSSSAGEAARAHSAEKADGAAGTGSASDRSRVNQEMTIVRGINGEVIAKATPRRRFTLSLIQSGSEPGDHASFNARGVPVLFFSTGDQENYHEPSDTSDRINYEGAARVVAFVGQILAAIDSSDARLIDRAA